jgi:hypothetical protein
MMNMNTEPITQAELDEWKKRGFYSERNKEIVDRLIDEVESLKATVRELSLDYHKALTETWKALGIEAYTGKAAWEHVAEQKQELDSLRQDKQVMDWLEKYSSQIDWDDDEPGWRIVYKIVGGRNDREFHEAGIGKTVRDAIGCAIARERKEKT